MGRGQQPLEQRQEQSALADRVSHVCKSAVAGGVTAERCLSSVDGDVPGPYPGEDRSNRSRGSDTRVAKRQRRRLLSAPPQVRVLPLVHVCPDECPHRLAGQGRRPLKAETRVRIPVGTPRARVRWMDSSSSKRAFAGSSPAGRTHAPAVRLERTPHYERGERRFESSRGYEASERSSTGECRPDMPEMGVQLPPFARETQLAPGSIWRGCPAVYRARRVRFPSGAPPWRGSLVRAAAL